MMFISLQSCESPYSPSSLPSSCPHVLSSPGAFFSWCTAQVRGQNSIGKGNFSDLEQIVYPPTAPSQPRCFLQDDFGGSVNITFTVTYPFTAVDLTVNYNWTSEVGTMDSASIPFGASSSNNILLPTSRLTMYDFQLWLCNSNGCSEPCQDLRNFSTSSVSGARVLKEMYVRIHFKAYMPTESSMPADVLGGYIDDV